MRIILATGPIPVSRDAIVIDHRNFTFWRGNASVACRAREERSIRFRLIAALLIAMPAPLPLPVIADHLWGDDPDGGPSNPRDYVSVLLCRNAPVLNFLGVFHWRNSTMGVGFHPLCNARAA